MSQESIRALQLLGLYALGAYALYAVLDGLRERSSRNQTAATLVFALLGFALGAYWMFRHLTCEPCQQRWRSIKRRLGLSLIE